MSPHSSLDDFVDPAAELGRGVRELCRQLESAGWFPRSLYQDVGVRYWPEEGRGKQIVVNLFYEINQHREEFLSSKTGIQFSVTEKARRTE